MFSGQHENYPPYYLQQPFKITLAVWCANCGSGDWDASGIWWHGRSLLQDSQARPQNLRRWNMKMRLWWHLWFCVPAFFCSVRRYNAGGGGLHYYHHHQPRRFWRSAATEATTVGKQLTKKPHMIFMIFLAVNISVIRVPIVIWTSVFKSTKNATILASSTTKNVVTITKKFKGLCLDLFQNATNCLKLQCVTGSKEMRNCARSAFSFSSLKLNKQDRQTYFGNYKTAAQQKTKRAFLTREVAWKKIKWTKFFSK